MARNAMLFFTGSSGGAIPGAPNNSLQWNNSGVFAGDSNAIVLATGELELTPVDDTHSALIVESISPTQTAPILDCNFGSTVPGIASFVFRGNGMGSDANNGPAVLQVSCVSGNASDQIWLTAEDAPANSGGFINFGSSGVFNFGGSPDGIHASFITFDSGGDVIVIPFGTGSVVLHSSVQLPNTNAGKLGFYGTAPIVQPTVSGSKVANPALASLMTALSALGLVIDTTT